MPSKLRAQVDSTAITGRAPCLLGARYAFTPSRSKATFYSHVFRRRARTAPSKLRWTPSRAACAPRAGAQKFPMSSARSRTKS
jgi:hypothetical protein